MLCLELTVNDERVCTAGVPDQGIFGASLMSGSHCGVPPRPGFQLSVTGVQSDQLVEWIDTGVFAGEVVVLRVVESRDADAPRRVYTEQEFQERFGGRSLQAAREEHSGLTKRIRQLEEKWGEQLRLPKDA
jgi:hypothetical protein